MFFNSLTCFPNMERLEHPFIGFVPVGGDQGLTIGNSSPRLWIVLSDVQRRPAY
jgi:hypothetical protein